MISLPFRRRLAAVAVAMTLILGLAQLPSVNRISGPQAPNGANQNPSLVEAQSPPNALSGTGYYFSTSGCPGAPAGSVPGGTTTVTLVVDWANVPAANPLNHVEYSISGKGPAAAAFEQQWHKGVITKVGATHDCVDLPLTLSHSPDSYAYYHHLLYSGVMTFTTPTTYTYSIMTDFPDNSVFAVPVAGTAQVVTLADLAGQPQTSFSTSDTVYIRHLPPCEQPNVMVSVTGPGGYSWQDAMWCSLQMGTAWQVPGTLAVGTYTVSVFGTTSTEDLTGLPFGPPLYPPFNFTVTP